MTHSVGYVGLGKMGQAMVLRMLEFGISVVGYNRTHEVTERFNNSVVKQLDSKTGTFVPSYSVKDLVTNVQHPRIIFLMVSAGDPVDMVINQLVYEGLEAGDVIIDGGNSRYDDSKKRAAALNKQHIHFIDCGVSGGIRGGRRGACLMLGGEKEIVESLRWFWDIVSTKDGWTYMGESGAGHFVKMVHNGVEYGIDQAIGEGFDVLAHSPYPLDLAKVTHNWLHGSIIHGYLLELLHEELLKSENLSGYQGVVGGGTTGAWTQEAAKTYDVKTPVLDAAMKARKDSYATQTFAGKVVSALRFGYGGHKEPERES